jgi:hypothetical protein
MLESATSFILDGLFYFMTKKQLKEIEKRAFAEELRASYAQQCDDVVIGIATHSPDSMNLFLMLLFAANKKKVCEVSFGLETAKLVRGKLDDFIKRETEYNAKKGGRNEK